jgi:hypothetical protein
MRTARCAVVDGRRREHSGSRGSAHRATAFNRCPACTSMAVDDGREHRRSWWLTLALDAYHLHCRQACSVIDGYSGDRRIFSVGAGWRGKVRDDAVRRQVVSDPHSPRQFRVNGVVRNIDAWYGLFGVQSDEKLFVAPDRRVRIW